MNAWVKVIYTLSGKRNSSNNIQMNFEWKKMRYYNKIDIFCFTFFLLLWPFEMLEFSPLPYSVVLITYSCCTYSVYNKISSVSLFPSCYSVIPNIYFLELWIILDVCFVGVSLEVNVWRKISKIFLSSLFCIGKLLFNRSSNGRCNYFKQTQIK